MTNEDKIEILASDVFDVDVDSVKADVILEESDYWDSMSKLALIAVFDSKFKRIIRGDDIKKFKTVQDILDAMN
jgi:acyl carrier protein